MPPRLRTLAAMIPLTVAALVSTASGFAPGRDVARAAESRTAPPDLVDLAVVDASIAQDIRYAGNRNFTGRRVPGYEAPRCLLRPAVAEALARVQADIAKADPPLSLKVFDCYRPERSVRSFMSWAAGKDDGSSRDYHPGLPRGALVAKGYIARSSTHSRGIAVDLTLMRQGHQTAAGKAASAQLAPSGPCTVAPPDEGELDMGSAFDCFDPKSHMAAGGIEGSQRDARQLLKRAMTRHGFVSYAKEWWHFTFPAADNGLSFDAPVR